MKTITLLHFGAVSVNRALMAIIALAVLLRVSTALYLGDRVEPISGAYDQVSYDALAQRLLVGHGFSFPVAWYPFTPPDQPTAQSSLVSDLGRLFSFTFYLPFMLYGLLLSFRHWRACFPLYLYIAFDSVLHLVSWVAPRYRLPSDALMIVFAALAVVSLVDRLKVLFRALAQLAV
jgi:hypothetical protein